MGVGPNYVLDKGFVATGSTAYAQGECVNLSGDGTKCARATGAGSLVIGVCQENVDATRVTTGKVVVDVRLLGITRVLAGAAVAVGSRVGNDATCRAVTVAPAAGANAPFFGVALTASTGAGQFIDVLLVPGGIMQG
jgi:hypothetical protein